MGCCSRRPRDGVAIHAEEDVPILVGRRIADQDEKSFVALLVSSCESSSNQPDRDCDRWATLSPRGARANTSSSVGSGTRAPCFTGRTNRCCRIDSRTVS